MSPQESPPPSKPSTWYPGIEWLRMIFIIFVVAMHLNLAQEFAVGLGRDASVTPFDVLLNQVFCTAVPGFLLISVFLQAIKHHSKEAVRSHLIESVYLYTFWVGGWIVWTHGRPEHGFLGFAKFFLKGGGWAFYFFVALLISHVISALIRGFSNRALWIGLMVSVAVVVAAFLLMAHRGKIWTRVETYWWPICFTPIPFAAILLARAWPRISTDQRCYWKLCSTLLLLSVTAALTEWSLSADAADLPLRPFLPEYLRASPLLTSCTMLMFALKARWSPAWVGFIARNSLGIFCLHVFILRGLHRKISDLTGSSDWSIVITLAVVIVGGAWATEFVRKIFRERLV